MLGFKKKEVKIYAPAKGKVVNLEEVPDSMFSSKMLGDGVAIEIEEDIICAPQSGIIKVLFQTKHAFVIETKEGAEILIHIGLDTVDLKGEGFQAIASVEDTVKAGDPIIKVDRALIKSKGINLITMILVTNIERFNYVNIVGSGDSTTKTEIIRCIL